MSNDPIVKMYLDRDEEGRETIRKHKKPAMRFRASGLLACKRQEFYRQSGFVPMPKYGFDDDWSIDGDVHHDVVRQLMLAYGIKLAGITQAEDGTTDEFMFVTHDFDVEGRTITISTRQDGWIFHEDHGWMLMEIKSVGHWVFNYIQKAYVAGWTDEVGNEYKPGIESVMAYLCEKKPDWIAQMLAGLAIAKAKGEKNLPFDASEGYTLDHSYLVIKDRSNCHIGFHDESMPVVGGIMFPFDQDKFDKILRRCYITKGKVLDGKPPIPEYPPSHKECGYCKFSYLCHGADKRRKLGLEPAIVYPDPEIEIDFNEEEPSDPAVRCGPVRKDPLRQVDGS